MSKRAREEFGTKGSEFERNVCDTGTRRARGRRRRTTNQPVAEVRNGWRDKTCVKMPNHLTVPFKKTYPAHVRNRVRDYLHNHSQDHPDRYKHDVAFWEDLRAPCIAHDVRIDTVNAFLRSVPPVPPKIRLTSSSYHAQLVFVLIKFPSDVRATRSP